MLRKGFPVAGIFALCFACSPTPKDGVNTENENSQINTQMQQTAFYASDFRSATEMLPNTMDGILSARELLQNQQKNISAESYDSIYHIFNESFQKLISSLNGKIESSDITQENSTKVLSSLGIDPKKFKELGLKVIFPEGFAGVAEDGSFLYNTFKNHVSEPYKMYLKLKRQEEENPLVEDAGLRISFEEASNRMQEWEKFYEIYPNSPFREATIRNLNSYLRALFIGFDNTPVFNYDDEKIKPEAKKALEEYALTYSQSDIGKLAKDFLKILQKCNNTSCDEIQNFYEAEIVERY